jgi:ribosomal protein L7/L12
MSECRNCGAPLSPSAQVCLYCDAPGPAAASAPAAPAPATVGAAWGSAIEIQAVGPNKISVIKAVRESAPKHWGLKEAKTLVEQPMPVRFVVDPSRAQAVCEALTRAGARARVVR